MVVISPSAEADLRSIKENIASDKPAAAIKWLDGIHKTFAMIDMHPEVGENRTEFSVKGCRSLTYGRYVIFFRRSEVGIEIARVIQGSRDLRYI